MTTTVTIKHTFESHGDRVDVARVNLTTGHKKHITTLLPGTEVTTYVYSENCVVVTERPTAPPPEHPHTEGTHQ